MKQVITFLVLSFLIAGSVYAAQIKSNETVCNANELLTYNTSRYVDAQVKSTDGGDAQILFDAQTIQIDKQTKIITVWTVWLESPKGRAKLMSVSGGVENFAYIKRFTTYDYSARRASTNMNCDGSTIYNAPPDEWKNISPDSMDEMILQYIMQKYSLK